LSGINSGEPPLSSREPWTREKELKEASEILLAWALEQGLSEDPKRIPKLYDEARRRWAHLTTRHGISQILEATLSKIPTE